MAWSLRDCEVGFEDKVGNGVVREAEERHSREAVEAVKSGRVIAVPTDTLYGFACDACSLEAVNRIYEIKGRKHTSPLAICVGDVSDIDRFAVTDHLPNGLLHSLLPGPVTVILWRGESSILEKSLNPGLESIGVRVPDCNFIRTIAHGSGSALALTSANLSGKPSSISVKDFENLWEHCAFVYDGGVLPSGRAGSTIVDLTKSGLYRILRPGSAMEETVAILEKHLLREEAVQMHREGNKHKAEDTREVSSRLGPCIVHTPSLRSMSGTGQFVMTAFVSLGIQYLLEGSHNLVHGRPVLCGLLPSCVLSLESHFPFVG